MKIAAHTKSTLKYSFEDALKLFKELGFDGFDIGCGQCGISISLGKDERKRIRNLINDSGLFISNLASYACGGDFHLGSFDEIKRRRAIDEQKRNIDLVFELGAMQIRVFCGKDIKDKEERKKCFDLSVNSLKELCSYAKKSNINLLVENHPSTLTVSAKDTVKIIESVNEENTGIVYDPSNLIVYDHSWNIEDDFNIQKKWIKHVHVKDQMKEEEGYDVVVGTGIVPWCKILSLLKNIDYQGYLALEYYGGCLPEPEIGLKESLIFLKGGYCEVS
ncbi:MAG: sugar phosphate isomerase/epimerase family protein [Candidatus Firestonebacteria bacterium]